MISIVWRFRPKRNLREQFEEMYASNGAWAALFRRGAGFHGTQLMRERESDCYLCIDRWETMQAFEAFKQKFAREYSELDRIGEALTEEELRVGIFEEL